MGYRLLIFGLMATLLTSCSLYDERDDCCYQIRLHYHETIDGVDLYKQDIKSMQHLLFDSEGYFIRWIDSPADHSQDVDITGLDNGEYTVITVANATDKTLFEDYDHISTFRLVHNGHYTRTRSESEDYADSDKLYWHKVTFTVDGTSKVIDCPLSNLHCHLHVTANWKGVPKQSGLWTIRLFHVHTEYQAGNVGLEIRERQFPVETNKRGDYRKDADTFNFELEGVLTTFRWTNARLPKLQIWCDDEPATTMMDLAKAFDEWGWYPDRAQVQEYWIDLQIGDDGSVDMRASGEARVNDWIDGGTIGY